MRVKNHRQKNAFVETSQNEIMVQLSIAEFLPTTHTFFIKVLCDSFYRTSFGIDAFNQNRI